MPTLSLLRENPDTIAPGNCRDKALENQSAVNSSKLRGSRALVSIVVIFSPSSLEYIMVIPIQLWQEPLHLSLTGRR